MKFKLVIFLFLISSNLFAQKQVQRDTSFTLYGTYLKEKKYRNYIEIAEPKVNEGVGVLKEQVYKKVGERALTAEVYFPEKKVKGNYPAIILIHGGGWISGDKSQTIPMAIALANAGYVAVCVEYRLSPEAKYPAAVYDIKTAVRWMRVNAKKFNINKNQIATLGMSAGGQLASLVGFTNDNREFEDNIGNAKQSSQIQAVVNIDGILAFRHPESQEGKVASLWLDGNYEENPQNWETAAPLNHVTKSSPPILFINSSIPRFHAGRDDMIAKLNVFNIYSEVYTLEDTPHPFWFFHPWFAPTVNYTVNFLDKIFKNQ